MNMASQRVTEANLSNRKGAATPNLPHRKRTTFKKSNIMAIAMIYTAQIQYWYEPTGAASEAIAALMGAVSDMDGEISEDNSNAERLPAFY